MSLTVTFHNIDNPDRTPADLQLLLIFCHLAAHNSRRNSQAAYMRLIDGLDTYVAGAVMTPFQIIGKMIENNDLQGFIKEKFKVSRPAVTQEFLESVVRAPIDLQTVSRDDLAAQVEGVGLTKASMFALYRDRHWHGAVINKEIQKCLSKTFNTQGRANMIPRQAITTERQYRMLESTFLELAEASKADPYDLNIRFLRQTQGETLYDDQDRQRIAHGGKATASHWRSRMSCKNINFIG